MDQLWEPTRMISCLAGSVCYTIIRPDDNWRRWLAHVLAGFLPALLLSPWVSQVLAESGQLDWLQWDTPHARHGLSFLFGLFGYVGCRALMLAGESYGGEWVGGMLQRIFGARGNTRGGNTSPKQPPRRPMS